MRLVIVIRSVLLLIKSIPPTAERPREIPIGTPRNIRIAKLTRSQVIIFMILVYRLPGFISGISLVAYAAIFAIVLSISQINLSLPGIAGIVLTIGMAVDSNVIIFERIKEELKNGKTLKSAVKAGFDRAFSAILDANVTTIIAAVVLWAFGTGSVQGFAKTLFVGVVISLFTALVITKVVLYSLVELKVNPKLFGSVKSDKE